MGKEDTPMSPSPEGKLENNTSADMQAIQLDNEAQLNAVFDSIKSWTDNCLQATYQDDSSRVQENAHREVAKHLIDPLLAIMRENVGIDGRTYDSFVESRSATHPTTTTAAATTTITSSTTSSSSFLSSPTAVNSSNSSTFPNPSFPPEQYDDLLNRNVIYHQEDVFSRVAANCLKRHQAPQSVMEKLYELFQNGDSVLSEREETLSNQRQISVKPPSLPDLPRALADLEQGVGSLETLTEHLPEYVERSRRVGRLDALSGKV